MYDEAPAYEDCYETEPIPEKQIKLLAKIMVLLVISHLRKE